MILRCTCESKFQDNMYGDHWRVCNPLLNGNQARCTICVRLVDIPGAVSRGRYVRQKSDGGEKSD